MPDGSLVDTNAKEEKEENKFQKKALRSMRQGTESAAAAAFRETFVKIIASHCRIGTVINKPNMGDEEAKKHSDNCIQVNKIRYRARKGFILL